MLMFSVNSTQRAPISSLLHTQHPAVRRVVRPAAGAVLLQLCHLRRAAADCSKQGCDTNGQIRQTTAVCVVTIVPILWQNHRQLVDSQLGGHMAFYICIVTGS